MQSTGHTSIQASQPVQLSARTTASSLGSFFRLPPAPSRMDESSVRDAAATAARSLLLELSYDVDFTRCKRERRAGVGANAPHCLTAASTAPTLLPRSPAERNAGLPPPAPVRS